MSDELALPPHLQDVKWLDLGRLRGTWVVIRPCRGTLRIHHDVSLQPMSQLWERLPAQQRRELLQISLIISKQDPSSSSFVPCATIGDFTLYEDDEIRYEGGLT